MIFLHPARAALVRAVAVREGVTDAEALFGLITGAYPTSSPSSSQPPHHGSRGQGVPMTGAPSSLARDDLRDDRETT